MENVESNKDRDMTRRAPHFNPGDRVVTDHGFTGTVVESTYHIVFGYSYLIQMSRFGYTKANEFEMSNYDEIAEHLMEKM